MANYKERRKDLYEIIIKETEVDKSNDNLITFSIDSDLKYINYLITKNNFKKYLNMLNPLFMQKTINIQNAQDILKDVIYEVYKTKVSQKRIPQILLNILVKEDFLHTDDAYDYQVKGNIKILQKIIKKYTK